MRLFEKLGTLTLEISNVFRASRKIKGSLESTQRFGAKIVKNQAARPANLLYCYALITCLSPSYESLLLTRHHLSPPFQDLFPPLENTSLTCLLSSWAHVCLPDSQQMCGDNLRWRNFDTKSGLTAKARSTLSFSFPVLREFNHSSTFCHFYMCSKQVSKRDF